MLFRSQLLVLILLPFVTAAFVFAKKRVRVFFILVALTACLFWTFSTTGFVLLAVVATAGIMFGPYRRFYFAFAVFGLIAFGIIILKVPDNYMVAVLTQIFQGDSSGTFASRFYSTAGPLLMTFKSYVLFGYGLGGTSVHFYDVIPDFAQKYILDVSWKEMPNLKSNFGRLFAETGILGTSLMVIVLSSAVAETRRALRLICAKSGVILRLIDRKSVV